MNILRAERKTRCVVAIILIVFSVTASLVTTGLAESPAPSPEPSRSLTTAQINDTVTRFVQAFNVNDLDKVMTFFSDDAVYEPGNGKVYRGKAAIRAAFEPQFRGDLGVMRFDERDRIIDTENGKAVFRWICRHDISQIKSSRPGVWMINTITRLFIGKRFGWQGLDVFHFDPVGKIKGKFTYGWYGSYPHLQPELGS